MRIRDLLSEATVQHVLRKTSRTIMISNVWHKTWQKAALGWDGVDQELQQFYQDKCWFDPPLAFGKKDYPLGSIVEKLRGTNHAHMHFGKVVIIYKVDQQHVWMYVAGDHSIVESGNLANLGKLVTKLNQNDWTSQEAPDRQVVQHDAVPDHIAEAVQELYEIMSTDADAYRVLRAFAQDIKQYWQVIPYQQLNPDLLPVTPATMHELAVAFLQQS